MISVTIGTIINVSNQEFTDNTCNYNNEIKITMHSTSALAKYKAKYKDKAIDVKGVGIPKGAKVKEIIDSTSFNLSKKTTGGRVTNGELTFQRKPLWISCGLIGGLLADLFLDFMSIWGTSLFLIAGFLMIIRGYFNLDYYGPFASGKEKWETSRTKEAQKKKQEEKEDAKRKHTQDLKSKIDAQKERDSAVIEPIDQEPEQLNIDPEETETVQETEYPEEEIEDDSDVRDDHFIAGKSPGVVADQAGPEEYKSEDHEPELEKGSKEDLNIEEIAKTEEVDIDAVVERQKPKRKYQLPSSELLANPVTISDNLSRDELVERANYLTQSMSTFGVEGKVVNVHPGPIITLFEVEPAEGIRVNKFVQLADDLARVMKASSVRVIAPIPGKSSVGIEIPNKNPATVYFKSVVNSQEFAEASSLLTLAIGKTTSGEISTLNLAKMPHLLIAGTTGSGKSVCINTIICSILYRATPDEVKFVMIDPKKVEMTLFKELDGYHLLKMEDIPEPIVTSVDNAILALRALEKEMDRRYNVLADAVVRNISEYNEKMKKDDEPIMPYIVLVVDELADLMMLSGKDVEAPIARLAQLARAVGIHLVIATQRPSVDVITGVIKANFSSRIAFQVASKIDSRTIIDQQGADKLIGRGDMLHLGTGSSDVIRMHNAFLSLEEIEQL
jgi:S-DNA-T family DNA segregation ATPase FtsK/SpoIIIE